MAPYDIIETKYGDAVIRKLDAERWRVHFINSGYTCVASKSEIDAGRVIDYLTPHVFNVGYGDYYQERLSYYKESVALWKDILRRVYVRGEGTIDESWHDYRVFRKDLKSVPFYGFHLKTGIGQVVAKGNHYSKENLKIWLPKGAINENKAVQTS